MIFANVLFVARYFTIVLQFLIKVPPPRIIRRRKWDMNPNAWPNEICLYLKILDHSNFWVFVNFFNVFDIRIYISFSSSNNSESRFLYQKLQNNSKIISNRQNMCEQHIFTDRTHFQKFGNFSANSIYTGLKIAHIYGFLEVIAWWLNESY